MLLAFGVQQTAEEIASLKVSVRNIYYDRLRKTSVGGGLKIDQKRKAQMIAEAVIVADEFATAAESYKTLGNDGVKRLSPELVADLELVVADGRMANDEMFDVNQLHVKTIAKRYLALTLEERTQEGSIGLLHAIKKFDYKKGFKFSTYSYRWITSQILEAIAEQSGGIGMPRDKAGAVRAMHNHSAHIAQDLQRQPTAAEISDATGSDEKWTEQILARQSVLSINAPIKSTMPGISMTLEDTIVDPSPGPADITDSADYTSQFKDALDQMLDDRERYIAHRRYGLGDTNVRATYQEIANELGIGRETVRLAEAIIIAKLIHPSSKTRWLLAAMIEEGADIQPAQANCYGSEKLMFVMGQAQHAAKRWCTGCAFAKTCLDDALSLGDGWGQVLVAGGQTARERRKQLTRHPEHVETARRRSNIGKLLIN
jgi:RNA polymerase sigma factor (sigma-70 family)